VKYILNLTDSTKSKIFS